MYRNILSAFMLSVLLVACGQDIDQPTNATISNEQQTNQMEENLDDLEANNQEIMEDHPDNHVSETPPDEDELNDLKVHYIDVGQADATLFQFTYDDKPFTILYDAGDWNKNDLVQYLSTQNIDRKSTRLNSSHVAISYAVFCLKKKIKK